MTWETFLKWAKGFQDWLEIGISPNIVAFKLFFLVLKGLRRKRKVVGLDLFLFGVVVYFDYDYIQKENRKS